MCSSFITITLNTKQPLLTYDSLTYVLHMICVFNSFLQMIKRYTLHITEYTLINVKYIYTLCTKTIHAVRSTRSFILEVLDVIGYFANDLEHNHLLCSRLFAKDPTTSKTTRIKPCLTVAVTQEYSSKSEGLWDHRHKESACMWCAFCVCCNLKLWTSTTDA